MLDVRHVHLGRLFAALGVLTLPTCAAYADLPNAIAVADDVADRIMLFDPHTGNYQGDLLKDADHLSAPFDCEVGPALGDPNTPYPDTVLVSDLRQQSIMAFDAESGSLIKTLIGSIHAHGMAYATDGRLLIAAGKSGVLAYKPDGTFVETRVAHEPVDGPNNAWDILVRPGADDGSGDMLVTDATLDVILRFDLTGAPLGTFAKLPSFTFVEQLALRASGNVLAVDVFGNAVHEFQPDGTWIRTITVTRPRGVFELYDLNLLVASEEGVQVFSGQTGELLETKMAGYPTCAPRYLRHLGCRLPFIRGDLNGDGMVNSLDIDAFALAITNAAAFAQQNPYVERICAGDLNLDGKLDALDIDLFIELLLSL